MSDFENKLVDSLREFADCKHKHLKCEKCGASATLFGWLAYSKEHHDTQTELAICRELLREACEKRHLDDEGNECEHVTSRWLNRAARAAGGEG